MPVTDRRVLFNGLVYELDRFTLEEIFAAYVKRTEPPEDPAALKRVIHRILRRDFCEFGYIRRNGEVYQAQ